MWESVNTFDLQLRRRDLDAGLRTGPYSIYSLVKERSALFWGLTARTMQKDEARAFLVAGGRHRGRRHGPAHAAGGAPADARAGRRGPRGARAATATRSPCCARSAASRPSCGRGRAARTPAPVARFMLYEREFPDSVAASVQSLDAALERVEGDRSDSSAPVLRVRRMLADLDFRARGTSRPEAVSPWLRPVQQELERLDEEIHDRYFQPQQRRRPDSHRMRFALRYHAEYRYSGPGLRPAQRAPREARGHAAPARARLPADVDPGARTRSYADYFGTEAIEFNVAGEHERLAITAEARGHHRGAARPPQAGWDALARGRLLRRRRRVPPAHRRRARRTARSTTCTARSAPTPRTRRCERSAR